MVCSSVFFPFLLIQHKLYSQFCFLFGFLLMLYRNFPQSSFLQFFLSLFITRIDLNWRLFYQHHVCSWLPPEYHSLCSTALFQLNFYKWTHSDSKSLFTFMVRCHLGGVYHSPSHVSIHISIHKRFMHVPLMSRTWSTYHIKSLNLRSNEQHINNATITLCSLIHSVVGLACRKPGFC